MREIPDFARVGVKRRCSEDIQKRVKTSTKEFCENPEIVPKHRNYLHFLSNRQLGETAGIQAKKEFYQTKTSHKEKASSSNFSIPFSYEACEVNFLKGDDRSLLGVWRLSNCRKKKYVMGEISYNMNNYAPKRYEPCGENIIDICRGSTDFVTVCNYHPQLSPPVIDILGSPLRIEDEFAFPWYCCCSIRVINAAVIGGNGFVIGVRGIGGSANVDVSKVPGKVYSVSLWDPSILLSMGLHTGEIHVMEPTRNPDGQFSVKISDKAINDSVFINGREVIATDIEDKLVKVDLRERKISATFFGHKHSVIKRPFSVANDMLCATGVDNVVRIWHISGGHPIYEQKSTSMHEVRSWLNSDGNKTYLNYFEGDTRTVFTI